MRNNAEKFLTKVREFLEHEFSVRVESFNKENSDIKLSDIALWQSGFSGISAGLTAYPGCLLLVNERTLVDAYSSTFNLIIALGVTADDPEYLEKMGRAWEDILEDTIRSDYHLGGAALDTALGVKITSDCVNNVYLIQAELACDVDLGGVVYV